MRFNFQMCYFPKKTALISIAYIIGYGIIYLFLNKFDFLGRQILVSPNFWMIIHPTVTLFTAFAGFGAALNLLLWRERAAVYTVWLAPALLIGSIFDLLHLFTVPIVFDQLMIFENNPEINLWFWLIGRLVFTIGFAISVFLIGYRPKTNLKMTSLRALLSLVIFSVSLITILFSAKVLPPLAKGSNPTTLKNLLVILPVLLNIVSATFLKTRSRKDVSSNNSSDLHCYSWFLIGVHLLILSQLFLLLSVSTMDLYSLIGHFLKTGAFWLFLISLWSMVVTNSYRYMNRFVHISVESLVEAIDSHEPSTCGHSKRVAVYAKIIGKAYGLTSEHLENLWLAAILHDTGKISLSQSLLEKPGPLTESEWAEVKKHPECGVKIIKPLELDWCEKAIIQHHERPDGKGYPAGIAGIDSIDLFARIIAIADTFDAITSYRHYRDARTPSEAKEIITQCSGMQFDPQCVSAFLRVFDEIEKSFAWLNGNAG